MSDPIGRVAQNAIAGAMQNRALDGGISVPFTRPDGAEGTGFGDLLTRAINEVSATRDHSSDMTAAFVRGEPVELHQVMAAAEESGIAIELLVEVRNKFVDAYRTLINMQN